MCCFDELEILILMAQTLEEQQLRISLRIATLLGILGLQFIKQVPMIQMAPLLIVLLLVIRKEMQELMRVSGNRELRGRYEHHKYQYSHTKMHERLRAGGNVQPRRRYEVAPLFL